MKPDEAEALLSSEEVVTALKGALRDVREVRDACLAQGIPTMLAAEACDKPGCTPTVDLLVREVDLDRVSAVLQERWHGLLASIDVTPQARPPAPTGEAEGEGEPPCPACGTAAPLVEGACSDCGLVLEG